VGVRLRHLVDFHFHLECVQLLLNLLGKHRRQAVACCDVATTIILVWCPHIEELDLWIPRDVAHRAVGQAASAAIAKIVRKEERAISLVGAIGRAWEAWYVDFGWIWLSRHGRRGIVALEYALLDRGQDFLTLAVTTNNASPGRD